MKKRQRKKLFDAMLRPVRNKDALFRHRVVRERIKQFAPKAGEPAIWWICQVHPACPVQVKVDALDVIGAHLPSDKPGDYFLVRFPEDDVDMPVPAANLLHAAVLTAARS